MFLATWGQYKQAPIDILADVLRLDGMSHVHVGESSKKELFHKDTQAANTLMSRLTVGTKVISRLCFL